MAADGRLTFDTSIDNSGFVAGVAQMTAAATAAAATITAGLSAAAIKVGSDFEASMSQVAATMGITSAAEEFEILSDAAKEMGESTKFSASQASEALNYLALAGYDAEKAVSALPTVLNVAAAGGMELASASDMITDAMSALGLETAQMSTFADQLAVTSQKSNTSVSQLGEAILTVGGTAKSLSGGVTEMNTALGILADNGIKGSEGGTALRNVILSLSAPTDTAAAALSKLGVNAFDLSGNMRPLEDTFADLNASLSVLSEQEKTAALNEIFNKVDLKSVNALLGTSAERFDELSGYIADCSGAAAQMAATMDDNLAGDLTIMQSALEGLGIAAYEKFQVPMRTAVQEVTVSIGELTASLNDGELSDSMDKVAEGFSSIVSSATELLANDVLPALINSFAWVVENADDLKTVLVAVGSAMVIYETATGAAAAANILHTASISGMSVALKEYTATSLGASVAASALAKANAAMSAAMLVNPIAAVAAVIGGIYIAAVSSAVSRQKELNAAAEQGSKIYAEEQQAIQELAEAYEDVNKKSEEMISAREDEISTLNALKSKLADNVDENGRITGSYETVKAVVEEINEIYPEQIELIDGQIKGYNDLAASIDGYIENLRKSTLIEAKREVYKTAIVTYDETSAANDGLYENAVAASEAYEEALAVYDKYNSGVNNFTAETKRKADEMGMSVQEYVKYQKDYTQGVWQSAWQAYSENKRLMDTAMQDMSSYEELLTQNVSSTGTNGEYKSTQQMAAEEYARNYTETMQETAQQLSETQKKNTEKLKTGWERAEHEYATGVIATEEDLYAQKAALLEKYGNA
ncbi:MAG: phage tail tape measure protein, partial [Muribaculaceae bacterium]|nr:phage tail tape measure protein [Muribaculaceae bacterium]